MKFALQNGLGECLENQYKQCFQPSNFLKFRMCCVQCPTHAHNFPLIYGQVLSSHSLSAPNLFNIYNFLLTRPMHACIYAPCFTTLSFVDENLRTLDNICIKYSRKQKKRKFDCDQRALTLDFFVNSPCASNCRKIRNITSFHNASPLTLVLENWQWHRCKSVLPSSTSLNLLNYLKIT